MPLSRTAGLLVAVPLATLLSVAEHRKDEAALSTLSRRGSLVVAEHSGHHIQLDESQLVVTTIQHVVAAAKRRSTARV
jgi:hypothetical protein